MGGVSGRFQGERFQERGRGEGEGPGRRWFFSGSVLREFFFRIFVEVSGSFQIFGRFDSFGEFYVVWGLGLWGLSKGQSVGPTKMKNHFVESRAGTGSPPTSLVKGPWGPGTRVSQEVLVGGRVGGRGAGPGNASEPTLGKFSPCLCHYHHSHNWVTFTEVRKLNEADPRHAEHTPTWTELFITKYRARAVDTTVSKSLKNVRLPKIAKNSASTESVFAVSSGEAGSSFKLGLLGL